MALASEVTGSTEIFSIMGISYPALESSNDGRRYPNYPMALVEQGVINTIAYSLWLDDLCTASLTSSSLHLLTCYSSRKHWKYYLRWY